MGVTSIDFKFTSCIQKKSDFLNLFKPGRIQAGRVGGAGLRIKMVNKYFLSVLTIERWNLKIQNWF